MKKYLNLLLILPIIFSMVSPVLARIGVGVGSGKITVDEILKPGIIYKLPSISVQNTGDVESDYTVSVAYHEKQPEKMPPKDWFKFAPQKFTLKPGEIKVVDITLDLPLKAEPGKYFAYLEASPVKKTQQGGTTVGIAAASKLYFTIDPANIFMGIYYKLVSLWKLYSPWSERIAGAIALVLIVLIGKNFVKIEFKSRKSNV